MNISKLSKKFTLQHGQSDCGPACLASVIRFHGGGFSLDEIRRITGTAKTGTKLLGLYQGAKQSGFEVAGLEADGIENLKELDQPAILHVILENRLQHYVVQRFIISQTVPVEKLPKKKFDSDFNYRCQHIGMPSLASVIMGTMRHDSFQNPRFVSSRTSDV